MYQILLYINWLSHRTSIKTIWGQPSNSYKSIDEYNHQDRNIDVLITALHELCLRKKIEMVETRSNMQLANLNSKTHGRKSLRYFIDRSIGYHIYTPQVSVNYRFLFLDQFLGPSHINFDQKKKSDIRIMKISNARNCTMKPRATQI